MIKEIRLKRNARKAYERYYDLVGDMSCGRSLAEEISVSVANAKREFNETMDKLAALDPSCPKTRL